MPKEQAAIFCLVSDNKNSAAGLSPMVMIFFVCVLSFILLLEIKETEEIQPDKPQRCNTNTLKPPWIYTR